jgi:beta-mannosidase
MPYCMGSLYWQLNDIWPAASWSSIDYSGNWKALHYAARQAFAPILLSPSIKNDSFQLYIVSDRPENMIGDLFIRVMDFTGKTIFQDGRYASIKSNSSGIYYSNDIKKMIAENAPSEVVIEIELREPNRLALPKTFTLKKAKELNLMNSPINTTITAVKGGYEIKLFNTVFCKGVCLSTDAKGHFDNNYFDMLPNRPYKVFLQSAATKEEIEKTLKVKSLVDSY